MAAEPGASARRQGRPRQRREQPQGLYRPGEGAQRSGVHGQARGGRGGAARQERGQSGDRQPVGRYQPGRPRPIAASTCPIASSQPSGDLYRICDDAGPRRGGADQAQFRAPAGLQRQRPAAGRKAGARRQADLPWLDQLKLEWCLSKAREYLGADDPQTKLLLGKESPEGLATRLVTTTRLADPAVPQGAVEWRPGGDRRPRRTR